MRSCDCCEYGVASAAFETLGYDDNGRLTKRWVPAHVTCKRFPAESEHTLHDWCGEFSKLGEVTP
jgi:hypothetical protein